MFSLVPPRRQINVASRPGYIWNWQLNLVLTMLVWFCGRVMCKSEVMKVCTKVPESRQGQPCEAGSDSAHGSGHCVRLWRLTPQLYWRPENTGNAGNMGCTGTPRKTGPMERPRVPQDTELEGWGWPKLLEPRGYHQERQRAAMEL